MAAEPGLDLWKWLRPVKEPPPLTPQQLVVVNRWKRCRGFGVSLVAFSVLYLAACATACMPSHRHAMATVEAIRQALADQSTSFNQELNRRDTMLSQIQEQMAALAAAQVPNGTTPPPPRPQPVHMMQGVVDLRLLGKPDHFDGQH